MRTLTINCIFFVISSVKGGADIGEEVFEGVDMNDDGKVDFKEFAMMTAGFAAANFEVLQEVMKEQGN